MRTPIDSKPRATKGRCARYGLTVNDYDTLFEKQGGRCAICGTHQKFLKRSLSIDHCHQTGKVRGLLCANCNTLLGLAEDSCGNLKRAAKYLKNFEKKLRDANPNPMAAIMPSGVDYG